MTHILRMALLGGALMGLAPDQPMAQPTTVSYQGQLLRDGSPFDGEADFKFVVVDGGASLWSNDGTSINGQEPTAFVSLAVEQGLFYVLLGSGAMVPLTADLLEGAVDPQLRIWVRAPSGSGEFEPLTDQHIASVPFSLRTDAGGTGGECLWETDGTNVFRESGGVGVGTSEIGRTLTVAGTGVAITGQHLDLLGTGSNMPDYDGDAVTETGVVAKSQQDIRQTLRFRTGDGGGGSGGLRWGYYDDNDFLLHRPKPDNKLVLDYIDFTHQPDELRTILAATPAGRIGIGTASPTTPLDVDGIIRSRTGGVQFPDGTVQTTASVGGESLWGTDGTNVYRETGKVGIGTNTPLAPLHVIRAEEGTQYVARFTKSGSGPGLMWLKGGSGGGYSYFNFDSALFRIYTSNNAQSAWSSLTIDGETRNLSFDGDVGVGTTVCDTRLHVDGGVDASLANGTGYVVVGSIAGQNIVLDDNEIQARNNGDAADLNLQNSAGNVRLVNGGGLVGIGTSSPLSLLDARSVGTGSDHYKGLHYGYNGDDGGAWMGSYRNDVAYYAAGCYYHISGMWMAKASSPSAIYLTNGNVIFQTDTQIADDQDFDPHERMRITNSGRVGIGTASPEQALDVNGTTRTKVLEIAGADLVESFDVDATAEPGTLLVIDDQNPGRLKASTQAYDNKVAGVVSGAGGLTAGILLGHGSAVHGSTPVAMTGRVFVKCTTENGVIRPGDMLTTSSSPGHAMRATDLDRSFGAVIGKAMSRLDSDTGLVLVLVQPR